MREEAWAAFAFIISSTTPPVRRWGSIILAVARKRAGKVPTAIAAGLPMAWAGMIPLATFGGSVTAGAYYLAVGHTLANRGITRGNPAAPQLAQA